MNRTQNKHRRSVTDRAATVVTLSQQSHTIGEDPDSFIARAKIDPNQIFSDGDARVDFRKVTLLYEALNNCPNNALLGFKMGQQMQLGDWGIVGHLMHRSANLQEAFIYLEKFMGIMSEHAHVYYVEKGKNGYFRIENAVDIMHLQITWQLFASSVLRFVDILTESQIKPQWMNYPANRILSAKELSTYFETDVCHEDYGITMCYNLRDLLKPLPSADTYLKNILYQEASIQLESLNHSYGTVKQVRTHMAKQLSSGQLTAASIADCLNISERSMQRHLAEEGTSFSKLLEQFRSENAGTMVKTTGLPISQIAKLLGYQNTTSFQRAFKRWQGTTPNQFRDNLISVNRE